MQTPFSGVHSLVRGDWRRRKSGMVISRSDCPRQVPNVNAFTDPDMVSYCGDTVDLCPIVRVFTESKPETFLKLLCVRLIIGVI